MYKSALNSALATGILILAFAGTSHAQQSPEPIRIGVSGPFTGGSAPMGESMRNGIRLAVEEINGIGGLNGRKIELVERDDEAKPEVGAKIANEFTQQKIVAAIGIVNTGVGLASIDAYQKARIPLVVAVSTGTSLTKKYAPPAAPENYIFRISPTLDLEAKVVLADLKRKGIDSAAILADTTAYGEAGLKAVEEQAASFGVQVASRERFNIGDTDMGAQVKRAKASGAQALVVWGIGPELAAIARNKDAAGWRGPMLGSWTFSMRNFIDGSGKAGEGALMPQTFIQDVGSSSKNSFLLAYRRAFNTDRIPSPMSAAQGYDGMHLLYLALRQANGTDGPKLKEALENLKFRYQGVITSYNKPFSAQDHDAITQNMLMMGVVSHGRVDYAYADDQKRGALLRMKSQ
ncbi:ABC transporter substrate-binding protein [Noviherbaspirillum galbum]|uniref:ABC transporter substrate-binding protein n=1 Tax=Noviherbaspirillum galbum TaxID=2709383 RepID=A0A6B3SSD3_9BURK|nr:ABC transporter substrate-binding protein [Noviherbaspirillum galbum]NEX62265.1 ABC transporter substrate-binding protein [Noviherbaspirillum galbum]